MHRIRKSQTKRHVRSNSCIVFIPLPLSLSVYILVDVVVVAVAAVRSLSVLFFTNKSNFFATAANGNQLMVKTLRQFS